MSKKEERTCSSSEKQNCKCTYELTYSLNQEAYLRAFLEDELFAQLISDKTVHIIF